MEKNQKTISKKYVIPAGKDEVLNFTPKDKRIFIKALLNPPFPVGRLQHAAERYKSLSNN